MCVCLFRPATRTATDHDLAAAVSSAQQANDALLSRLDSIAQQVQQLKQSVSQSSVPATEMPPNLTALQSQWTAPLMTTHHRSLSIPTRAPAVTSWLSTVTNTLCAISEQPSHPSLSLYPTMDSCVPRTTRSSTSPVFLSLHVSYSASFPRHEGFDTTATMAAPLLHQG